jgi:hypothetical protein
VGGSSWLPDRLNFTPALVTNSLPALRFCSTAVQNRLSERKLASPRRRHAIKASKRPQVKPTAAKAQAKRDRDCPEALIKHRHTMKHQLRP